MGIMSYADRNSQVASTVFMIVLGLPKSHQRKDRRRDTHLKSKSWELAKQLKQPTCDVEIYVGRKLLHTSCCDHLCSILSINVRSRNFSKNTGCWLISNGASGYQNSSHSSQKPHQAVLFFVSQTMAWTKRWEPKKIGGFNPESNWIISPQIGMKIKTRNFKK